MTDTKRPFAQAERDAVVMAGIQLLAPDTDYELVKSYANEINAAVASREKAAAVKALRDLSAELSKALDEGYPVEIKLPGGYGVEWFQRRGLSDAARAADAHAERIERGTA